MRRAVQQVFGVVGQARGVGFCVVGSCVRPGQVRLGAWGSGGGQPKRVRSVVAQTLSSRSMAWVYPIRRMVMPRARRMIMAGMKMTVLRKRRNSIRM